MIFHARNSEGDILSTITIGDSHPNHPKTLKGILEYWWNEVPYGYKLERYSI